MIGASRLWPTLTALVCAASLVTGTDTIEKRDSQVNAAVQIILDNGLVQSYCSASVEVTGSGNANINVNVNSGTTVNVPSALRGFSSTVISQGKKSGRRR